MRLLKYKAYLREYDRIVEVEQLELLANGEVQSIVVSDWEITEETYRFTKGQFELMEFTGFRDTNNNEVYSEHIIKCGIKHNVKALQGFQARVVWDHIYATFGIEHPTEGFFLLSDVYGYEIIGNIYQDKELLND
nr:MAG TPA: YopX protein [Caudoviricetes sp.]